MAISARSLSVAALASAAALALGAGTLEAAPKKPTKAVKAPTVSAKHAPKAKATAPATVKGKPPAKLPPTAKLLSLPQVPQLLRDVGNLEPQTKAQVAAAAKDFGVLVNKAKVRKRMTLTPKKPWLNDKTYVEYHGGVNTFPQFGFVVLDHGAKASLNFEAEPRVDYVVTCSVAGGDVWNFGIKTDGGPAVVHGRRPDAGWASVALPADSARRSIEVDVSWTHSGFDLTAGLIPTLSSLGRCDIVPANP